jgi:thiamine-monophosphate kinase
LEAFVAEPDGSPAQADEPPQADEPAQADKPPQADELAHAGSVAQVGEFGLIGALAARFPAAPRATVGIGDDSAVLATPDGNVVAAVDFLLEGRHFRRDWSSGYDVGVKAAARSLADIAAMGAVPTALLLALALPGDLPAAWALDFAAGLAAECQRAGAGVIGGDTARAEQVIVSVTALGSLPDGAPPVRRSGARPGDVVAVAGRLGYSAAGLALLACGVRGCPDVVMAHRRPSPPYEAGAEAGRLGATAMIDTSDGLLADLGHVAAASGVAIDIATGALDLGGPLADAVDLLAKTTPAPALLPSPLEWVLTGGEDHSLAATFPASTTLPSRWRVIGTVRGVHEGSAHKGGGHEGSAHEGGAHEGGGVTVDGVPHAGPGGWEHFR